MSSEAEIVHIAGQPVQLQARYVRQRCSWCGALIEDIDLQRTAVYVGDENTDTTVPLWPTGELVAIDGNMKYCLGDVSEMPPNCCANIELDVTR